MGLQTGYYKLNVGSFSGNGGDSLRYHNGKSFTTIDQDHDRNRNHNCASESNHGGGAGWWYNACVHCNLNGLNHGYAKATHVSMAWYKFGNKWESLKKVSMAIRPLDNGERK